MIYCLKCSKVPDFEIREEEETYTVKRVPITTLNQVTYCKDCGTQLWNEPLEEINLRRVYAKYEELTGKSARGI